MTVPEVPDPDSLFAISLFYAPEPAGTFGALAERTALAVAYGIESIAALSVPN